jgi:hypothetical protein
VSSAGKFKHIRALLEREIYLRSVKHVFNRILREDTDESDLLLSDIVCHVLNCLLAPAAMIQALNAGEIKFEDDSVQSKF